MNPSRNPRRSFSVPSLAGLVLLLTLWNPASSSQNAPSVEAASAAVPGGAPRRVLLVEAPPDADFARWQSAIQAGGFELRHAFPPAGGLVIPAAGQSTEEVEAHIPAGSRLFRDPPAGEEAERLLARPQGQVLWLAHRALLEAGTPEPAPGGPPGAPLVHDARVPPTGPQGEAVAACDAAALLRTNSEYLLGSVTVNVILPESTGAVDPGIENWDSTRESYVSTEIVQGLNDLSAYFDAYVGVARLRPSWTYHFTRGRTDAAARTVYEPISRPQADESLWVGEIFDQLGYAADPDIWEKGKHFNGDRRTADKTKWAFTIFVVDSLNDSDGTFAFESTFAYAYLDGPFLVMTYDNDGWGIGRMNLVTRHEVSHIFNALDEYVESGCTCDETSGYVSTPNQNCLNSCPVAGSSCIMIGTELGGVCEYTRGMIGWGDLDGNNVPDPVNPDPETALDDAITDPPASTTFTFQGVASIPVLPNQNLYGYRCDRNILTVAGVTYRVDGGSWHNATPADGVFDGGTENYVVKLSLTPGSHTLETRGADSLGRLDPTPALLCSDRWYRDGDGDGHGGAVPARYACAQPPGFAADAADCDDSDPLRFPGNAEACDGRDGDCDGVGEVDAEGDGFLDCNDNCALVWNPDQADAEGDLVGDACGEAALFTAADLSKAGFSAGRIDGRDLAVFAEAFGTCPGQVGYNPAANLDGVPSTEGPPEACIGMADFHLFMDQFARSQ